MSAHDPNPERLNEALDAIRAGAAPADACAELPDALRPLAETALRIEAARGAGNPRPSFVLGLEERLRADLRLNRPAPTGEGVGRSPEPTVRTRPRWRRAAAVAAPLLIAAVALFGLVERSDPRDVLYPIKRTFEAARVLMALTAADRAETYLQLGWRRLQEVEALVRMPGAPTDPTLADLLEGLAEAYGLALANAEASADERVAFLAQSEARAALDRLHRLAAETDPGRAERMRQVRAITRDEPVGEPEILAVVWVPASDLRGPVTAPGVRPADLVTPAVIVVGPPPVSSMPGATSATPSPTDAPPGGSATARATAEMAGSVTATGPAPTTASTASIVVATATRQPATTTVAPPSPTLVPPTATTSPVPPKPSKPKPSPRPPTATPPVPPSPPPTEEPWLTATAAPTRVTPGPWAVSPTPDPPRSPEPSPTPGGVPPASGRSGSP